MSSLMRWLVLALIVGGWGLAAASVLVVRTPERVVIVPRARVEPSGILNVYHDARTWTATEAEANPEVIDRLLSAGKADAVAYIGSPEELQKCVEAGRAMAVARQLPPSTLPSVISPAPSQASPPASSSASAPASNQPSASVEADAKPKPPANGPVDAH